MFAWACSAEGAVDIRVQVNRISHLSEVRGKSIEVTPSGKGHYLLAGTQLTLRDFLLPPQVSLYGQPDSSLDVVIKLDLEDYLLGVLPHEMPSSWPLEALKAQAVAARSYALVQIQMNRSRHFDVVASTLDQVYRWSPSSKPQGFWASKVTQAVEITRGEILVNSQGRPLKAYYHADCGGQTEAALWVWGGGGKKSHWPRVRDRSCGVRIPWVLHLSPRELQNQLESDGNKADPLYKLSVVERSPSGRVHWVRLQGKNGSSQLLTGQQLRQRLGFQRLKSTLFHVTQNKKGWVFTGRGHGHGVGLCQRGAHSLARKGWTYQRILSHYYPQARVVKTKAYTHQLASVTN